MSDSNEELMLQELRRISKLLALSLIEDKTLQSEKIEMLDRYGFQQKEIADLLKTTPNTVSAHLSNIRKKIHKSQETKVAKEAKIE